MGGTVSAALGIAARTAQNGTPAHTESPSEDYSKLKPEAIAEIIWFLISMLPMVFIWGFYLRWRSNRPNGFPDGYEMDVLSSRVWSPFMQHELELLKLLRWWRVAGSH